MEELNILNHTTQERIAVTDKAAQEILRIKASDNIPDTAGLRIGIKGGGCSGFSYVLGFDEKAAEMDIVFEVNGVTMFVDQRSLAYLSGTELDFSDGLNGRGFVFNNPHAVKTCGCGNSFAV
jgi:iron-sulfur cluster assembly protein